jgi:purine-cytosine permease-like protein
MGLLWLTMVASFPAVLCGFEWYRQGITLPQLALCSFVSVLLLLLYSVPACALGSRTGLGYCQLGRIVFGRWGGIFLMLNLIWLFVAWYAFTAVLMAQAVNNLFHWNFSVIVLSVIFAILMALNNFFGFSGVANFARFMAAPVLIIWVSYVLWKVAHDPLPIVTPSLPHPNTITALSLTSSFIIGFAVWGNEQDYWRYSKPGIWRSLLPLLASIGIGQILFPIAGWFIARATESSDYTSTLGFMSNYCFGGVAIIGLIILTADYFSTNDCSLFGCATALETFLPINHMWAVGVCTILGAIIAAFLSMIDMTQSFSTMLSLNCIILPTPTIIMIAERCLQCYVFKQSNSFVETNTPCKMRWPALISLVGGLILGVITSGLIPGLSSYHIGLSSINAWICAVILFVPLRICEHLMDRSNFLGST